MSAFKADDLMSRLRALALILFPMLWGGCTKEAAKPPVILIVLDALHADHVSHLGYHRNTTPNLDRLAAEGITFMQALAPAPYTLASIPSLLTGRLPDTHGLTQKNRPKLSPDELTLAEILKRHGYRTLGAVANGSGSSAFGIDQGFDTFIEIFQGPGGPDRPKFKRRGSLVHIPLADEFLPVVKEWLRNPKEDGPCFYYLHILEPHSPYAPPEPFRSRYVDPEYRGPFRKGQTKTLVNANKGKVPVKSEDKQATIDLYDANIAWADHVLGLLIDEFRAAGVYDNAYFIVTSDHGEAFWQHGLWGHNDQLYDEMLHVPLVVKFPEGSGEHGSRISRMVSLMDLFPGICQWLDLDGIGPSLDGFSLAEAVENPDAPDDGRNLLIRSHHEVPHLSLRTKDQKLIVMPLTGGYGDFEVSEYEVEFYDLENDPEERADKSQDLSTEWNAQVERLKELANRLGQEQAERSAPLPESQEALLEALGY